MEETGTNTNTESQEGTENQEGTAQSLLKEAKETAEILKKEKEETLKILGELQEERAKELISGKSEAGQKEPQKEETPEEYKNKVMSGVV